MGRSYTPKYRVELVVDNSARSTGTIAWDRRYGRATTTNLTKIIRSIEASFQPGGANAHLKPVSYISATIVDQSSGNLVAFYSKQENK
jgi:hypothetical protein